MLLKTQWHFCQGSGLHDVVYLSVLGWQFWLASFPVSHSPLLKTIFCSSCQWLVLKILNPQGFPEAQNGGVLSAGMRGR